jgi:hypothetical protein
MASRIVTAIVSTTLLVAAETGVAQTTTPPPILGNMEPTYSGLTSGDVTFELPLNLTQVDSDIMKVEVKCFITSEAITPHSAAGLVYGGDGRVLGGMVELPVDGGQLVTTAQIVVPTNNRLVDPIGKSATYACQIRGYSIGQQNWGEFSETHSIPAFRLTPTPEVLTGTFTW